MGDSVTDKEKVDFFSEMEALSELYKTVKHLVLLSEYYNSKQGIVVSTINELRNSLDHIMRALFDAAKSKDELFKAKGHLYRAAYDASEVIIIDRLEYINQFKNEVGFYALNKAYPEYYTEVLPEISVIKEELAVTRENPNSVERIGRYEATIEQLILICNNLDAITPILGKNYESSTLLKGRTLSMLTATLGLSALFFYLFSVVLKVEAHYSIGAAVGISSVCFIVWYHSFRNRKRHD
jgi:UDP-N-acetylmuramyl tripeptide synthase